MAAAILFGTAQSAPIMVEGEWDSVRIKLPLMQINADTVCLVRVSADAATRPFSPVTREARSKSALSFGVDTKHVALNTT
jgi:hypothetical protein